MIKSTQIEVHTHTHHRHTKARSMIRSDKHLTHLTQKKIEEQKQ